MDNGRPRRAGHAAAGVAFDCGNMRCPLISRVIAAARERAQPALFSSDQDDGGTIEPRRRAAGQAGFANGFTGRGERRRQGHRRQGGSEADGAHHGAAGTRHLAVVMVGRDRSVPSLHAAIAHIMMMGMSRMHLRHHHAVGHVMVRRGERRGNLIEARLSAIAERDRCRRADHAEQVGEDEQASSHNPHLSCQSQCHALANHSDPTRNLAQKMLHRQEPMRSRIRCICCAASACPMLQQCGLTLCGRAWKS